MKALVTGSSGFIGKHLCKILREDGHEVIGLDRTDGFDVVTCDLPVDVDRVFHLAAQTDARSMDAVQDAQDNIMTAVRIMQHYKEKVTYSSSAAVNYPTSPYSISKLTGERYARLYGCGVVRFCNIHGSGSRSFIDIFRDKEIVHANLPGNQIRTYAHVDKACIELLCCRPGEFHILAGQDLTVHEIIDTVYASKKTHWHAQNKYDVIEGRQVYAL